MFERLRRHRPDESPAQPAAPAPARQIEVLTIAFELDVRLCQLQLTSFDRFFDLDTVAKYTVLVNGGEEVLEQLREHALTLSAELRDKLVLLPTEELRKGDFNSWRGQQLLKLIFARRVKTSHYLVVDAKMHLVKPASAEDWFDEHGRARTYFTPAGSLMGPMLKASYEVFGITDRDPEGIAMPTVTPYLLITSEVLAMIRAVTERSGVNFGRSFMRTYPKVGEFFLYYAHLIHTYGSVDHLYYDEPRPQVSLFTWWPPEPEIVHREIGRLADPEILFFGLHRNRLPQLDDSQSERIAQVWEEAGLLTAHPASYYLTPLAPAP